MSPPRRHRRTGLALIAVSLWVCAAAAAPPPSPFPVPPGAQADDAGRALMFRRLAEADQLLKRGRPRAAARAFREVFIQAEGTQWGTLAELGMAWSIAAGGDLAMARALAADAHASSGTIASASSVVFGLLSARAGDYPTALAQLDVAAATAATQPATSNVIRLTRAYVLFWSGEFARAAGEFDAVSAAVPRGGLADDARYGAAWSRWKAGEAARAHGELDGLVRDAPPGFEFQSVPRRLVELDAKAVLGDSNRRYRRGGVQAPDAQLERLLDSDGYSRARSALGVLAAGAADATRPGSPVAADVAPAPGFAEAGDARARAAAKAAPAPVPALPSAAPRRASRPVFAIVALLVLLALAVAFVLSRRQRVETLPKRR